MSRGLLLFLLAMEKWGTYVGILPGALSCLFCSIRSVVAAGRRATCSALIQRWFPPEQRQLNASKRIQWLTRLPHPARCPKTSPCIWQGLWWDRQQRCSSGRGCMEWSFWGLCPRAWMEGGRRETFRRQRGTWLVKGMEGAHPHRYYFNLVGT